MDKNRNQSKILFGKISHKLHADKLDFFLQNKNFINKTSHFQKESLKYLTDFYIKLIQDHKESKLEIQELKYIVKTLDEELYIENIVDKIKKFTKSIIKKPSQIKNSYTNYHTNQTTHENLKNSITNLEKIVTKLHTYVDNKLYDKLTKLILELKSYIFGGFISPNSVDYIIHKVEIIEQEYSSFIVDFQITNKDLMVFSYSLYHKMIVLIYITLNKSQDFSNKSKNNNYDVYKQLKTYTKFSVFHKSKYGNTIVTPDDINSLKEILD